MDKNNKEFKKQKLRDPIELFESSVSPWWKNLKNFLLIYLEGIRRSAVAIVVIILFYFFKDLIATDNLLTVWLSIVLILASYLTIFYYTLRSQISIFLFIKSDYKGTPLEIFSSSSPFFWSYLWINILMMIIIMPAVVAMVGSLIGMPLAWILLLTIPSMILVVFYSFATYSLFWENKKGVSAFARSWRLVKNYFWPVLLRVLFVSLVAFTFSTIASLPLMALKEGTALFGFWNLVVQILSFVISPIFIIYSYKIYKSLVSFEAK